MSGLGILGYIAIFVGASVLSLALVPMALRLAIRLEVLDHPGGYKQQETPIPYLGGVAIVAAFASAVVGAALVQPPVGGPTELVVIMACALGLSLVGLLDDLRHLPIPARFAAMFLASGIVWLAGVRIQLSGVTWLDLVLTLVWVVGVTNAFNLLDNMDGLSAGLAVVAATSFFLIAALNGQFLVAALSAALAGAALGFLRHNRYPARIYMGDSGSLFLGFLLAIVGVKLRFDAPNEITAVVPVIVLGVAIFDTTLVVVTRVARGRHPLRGARDHASHRLAALGMPVRYAVATLYTAGFALGALALVTSRLEDVLTAYVMFGSVVLVSVSFGFVLARVPIEGASEWRPLAEERRPTSLERTSEPQKTR